jgi:hypothetical protein
VSNSNFVSEAGSGPNVNNGAIAVNSAYLSLAGGICNSGVNAGADSIFGIFALNAPLFRVVRRPS